MYSQFATFLQKTGFHPIAESTKMYECIYIHGAMNLPDNDFVPYFSAPLSRHGQQGQCTALTVSNALDGQVSVHTLPFMCTYLTV